MWPQVVQAGASPIMLESWFAAELVIDSATSGSEASASFVIASLIFPPRAFSAI